MDQVDPREPIPRHVAAGAVPLGVKHLCPAAECGWPINPHCPWCRGTGTVSGDELAAWQRAENARGAAGG